MKTDTIFYSLFQAFPSIFFELINQPPAEAIVYKFTSCEVKQLAFRLDGLFLPITNDRKKPLYIVEVQFQPDLDELSQAAETSAGVGVVKLVIEAEETAPEVAKRLIEQAKQQVTDQVTQRDLINLIETIIVYKLPQKSREEIEAMLGLSELKQTKVYQEALEEGKQQGKQQSKLEAIPRMIKFGLSLEAIAQLLDLPLEVVQQAAESFQE
ncbi:MAG: Rpn family recombination-promoting nuclease/putative transposase [Nostoc sp. SerVER01]|nr:Rpn family recombination-promoting nuclease/putative transposase [Nostoc sp. SerVER01]MDZ8073254.1 Rpn family recombination-promoting nuclease/putative transposase [Nostoc sp. DedQUE01]